MSWRNETNAGLIEQLITAEREACCADMCGYCAQGMAVWRQNEKVLWVHTGTGVRCLAAAIRERAYQQSQSIDDSQTPT